MDKFCNTQKMPTQKSATAKFARKKFVIDRNRRESVTTKITRRFPANRKFLLSLNVVNLYCS